MQHVLLAAVALQLREEPQQRARRLGVVLGDLDALQRVLRRRGIRAVGQVPLVAVGRAAFVGLGAQLRSGGAAGGSGAVGVIPSVLGEARRCPTGARSTCAVTLPPPTVVAAGLWVEPQAAEAGRAVRRGGLVA